MDAVYGKEGDLMPLSELGAAVLDTAKEAVKETGEKISETAKEISGKGESIFPDFFKNLKIDTKTNEGTSTVSESRDQRTNNPEGESKKLSDIPKEADIDAKDSDVNEGIKGLEPSTDLVPDNAVDNPTENQNDTNENPTLRELTPEEKEKLKEIGMSDSNIEKCRVDENGIYHLKTINEGLEGTNHPITGVPYERKQIEVNGVKIEGVFPKFDSVFSCMLDEDNLQGSDQAQFSDCMKKLREAVDSDPELASKFSARQLEQIHDTSETNVSGYTWHHNEETGKMELVKTSDHGPSNHTGGKSIWGGGQDNR